MPDRWLAGAVRKLTIMITVLSSCLRCSDRCGLIVLIICARIAIKAKARATGNWMWRVLPIPPVYGA